MNVTCEHEIIHPSLYNNRMGVDLCALVVIIFNLFVTFAFYSSVIFK
jgi:hypothetical protein